MSYWKELLLADVIQSFENIQKFSVEQIEEWLIIMGGETTCDLQNPFFEWLFDYKLQIA